MRSEPSLSDLYALRGAAGAGHDWPRHHHEAIASGRGVLVADTEERVAAVDELLVCSLRELVTLGELAGYASFPALADDVCRPLARGCAALVRLLDTALATDGRNVGYDVAVWRRDVSIHAALEAAALDDDSIDDDAPLPDSLRRGAGLIGDALGALRRDRLGLPELLAQAAGIFLVGYVAAAYGQA